MASQASNASEAVSSQSTTRVALVTGANKGIGKEILLGLVNSGDYSTVLLGCRDLGRGEKAKQSIESSTLCTVECIQVDITDHDTIAKTATYISNHFDGCLHLLVNNAGFAYKGSTWGADEANTTLNVNFRGTKHMTEAMLPQLRKTKGIVINVASSAGYLSQVAAPLQKTLTSDSLTHDKLEELAVDFVDSVRSGQHSQHGWSSSMYGVSKLLEIACTRLHSTQEAPHGVAVYCMCPGYCVTDMTSGRGNKTAAQGAETALFLAAGGGMRGGLPTGAFYADCKQKTW